MSNIPVIDRVTPEQWTAAFADAHLSETYRAKNSNKQELIDEFTNRVKSVCAQRLLPLPKKIVFISLQNDAIRVTHTGELHIHPLTFVACNLERNEMTPKQQALYKCLENYISDKEAGTVQFERTIEHMEKALPSQENENSSQKNSSKFILDSHALTETYQNELLTDIKDYQQILPSKEFDELLASALIMHKALKFDKVSPALVKLTSIALAALSAYKVGGAIGNWASESMYWPVTTSAASLAAVMAYKCFNNIVYTWRVMNVLIDKDAKKQFSTPLHEQSAETKIVLSKMELNKI